jgi:tetratricopeptide (TPR) repeat protein
MKLAKNNLLIFLVTLLLAFLPGPLLSNGPDTAISGPVADSILEQQRDSILFSLNLEYLNGVNEHKTPFELIPIIEEILTLDPAQYNYWFNLGMENIKIKEYYRALDALNRGLELYPSERESNLDQIYISLSFCYHKTEKHQKEREILDRLSAQNPNNPGTIGRYLICAHYRMRFSEEVEYRKHLVSVLRWRMYDESDIAFYLGRLYLNEDYLEAEKYFRIAYQYDPDNVEKMGALAWVLIKNALRIDEGMALIERAIEADPGNAVYIHQQGYGFYMKGNYEDALFNLYNARELYQEYSYELDTHILMVEEAIARLAEQQF